jgi:zinc/manganese transport system ATP-binding protein
MSAAVRLADLTLGYDRHPAVHHIDGEIGPGALVAVVGPNGAGKSTLLKGIVGALRPLSGAVELAGIRARDIAYLPQAAELDRSFPIAVDDVVAMGFWRRAGLFGGIGRRDRTRIAEAIAAVGLTGFERRAVGTLSGGQLQRVLFARLLLQDAPVILLDEPFAAIDGRTVEDLLALILRWHGEGRTVVAVLHDLDLVRRTFPETLLLAREKVAWAPTAEALQPENLLRARAMVEAFDRGAHACRRDAA